MGDFSRWVAEQILKASEKLENGKKKEEKKPKTKEQEDDSSD